MASIHISSLILLDNDFKLFSRRNSHGIIGWIPIYHFSRKVEYVTSPIYVKITGSINLFNAT